jgi:hypothetical protein
VVDYREIEVRLLKKERFSPHHSIEIWSRVHPSSYPIDSAGLSAGDNVTGA